MDTPSIFDIKRSFVARLLMVPLLMVGGLVALVGLSATPAFACGSSSLTWTYNPDQPSTAADNGVLHIAVSPTRVLSSFKGEAGYQLTHTDVTTQSGAAYSLNGDTGGFTTAVNDPITKITTQGTDCTSPPVASSTSTQPVAPPPASTPAPVEVHTTAANHPAPVPTQASVVDSSSSAILSTPTTSSVEPTPSDTVSSPVSSTQAAPTQATGIRAVASTTGSSHGIGWWLSVTLIPFLAIILAWLIIFFWRRRRQPSEA